MELTNLRSDDSAVSPVIGVILMVAITVILAAVIATFVLGLGDQVGQTAPQASFSFDYDGPGASGDNFTVAHAGGDPIEATELYVRSSNTGVGGDGKWSASPYGLSGDVTAGESISTSATSNETVRIVFESSTDSNSATLGEWVGPNA